MKKQQCCSPILVITKSKGRSKSIGTGIKAAEGLVKHAMRLTAKENPVHDIDPQKTHLNRIIWSGQKTWEGYHSREDRQKRYDEFLYKYKTMLHLVKQQLDSQNDKYIKQHAYTKTRSFAQYMCKKQPVGEWIMSVSRDWFVQNKIIKVNNKHGFEVLDKTKLNIWANTIYEWAYQRIAKSYGKNNFIGAMLHLDENNPHIHFHYLRFQFKYDKRTKGLRYDFSNPEAWRKREFLHELQEDYLKVYNKKLLYRYDLHVPVAFKRKTKEYYNLLDFKIACLEKNVKRLTLTKDRLEKRMIRKNMSKLRKLNLEIWMRRDYDFIMANKQRFLNIGYTKKDFRYAEYRLRYLRKKKKFYL